MIELSEQQQQIMECLAEGLTYKEVARRLEIHIGTISQQVARAKEKIGVSTVRKAVIAFIEMKHAGWASDLEYLSWNSR